MGREISVAGLEGALEELSYPAVRTDAAMACTEITVVAEDTRVNLGEAIDATSADVFDAPEDLQAAVRDAIATEHVL